MILDTAGRLQIDTEMMAELLIIDRVWFEDRNHERCECDFAFLVNADGSGVNAERGKFCPRRTEGAAGSGEARRAAPVSLRKQERVNVTLRLHCPEKSTKYET